MAGRNPTLTAIWRRGWRPAVWMVALPLALFVAGCGSPAPIVTPPPAAAPSAELPGTPRIEAFWPRYAAGPAPAVIVLHGASGIVPGNALYAQADALAAAGFAVFVLHYLDGLGVSNPANPRHYARRDEVIARAIDRIERLPGVDPARLGLYGYSLGGFHALGLAGRDSRLAAIASVGGALSRHLALPTAEQLPSILLLHGERDSTVPVTRARTLARALEGTGRGHEVRFYADQGHSFRGSALTDSIARTVAFFTRTLAPPDPSAIALSLEPQAAIE